MEVVCIDIVTYNYVPKYSDVHAWQRTGIAKDKPLIYILFKYIFIHKRWRMKEYTIFYIFFLNI